MPRYVFNDTRDNTEVVEYLSIKEVDQFLLDHPHLKMQFSAPSFGDPVRMGITKTPDGFQDLLKNAKKKNPGSNIQTRT
jgi:hypothetical protein